MFSPAEFEPPPKPRSAPFWDNRILGTILLALGIVLLILMATSYDRDMFIPYSETLAVTQTWRAQQPPLATPTLRNQRRATPTPQHQRRPDDERQSAWFSAPASQLGQEGAGNVSASDRALFPSTTWAA